MKYYKFKLNFNRLRKHRINVYKNLGRQTLLPVLPKPAPKEKSVKAVHIMDPIKELPLMDRDPSIGFEPKLVSVKTKLPTISNMVRTKEAMPIKPKPEIRKKGNGKPALSRDVETKTKLS